VADMENKSVLYPGSFDPLTNGHLDLICRAARIFDKVYVAVAKNYSKTSLFTTEERVELVNLSCADLSGKIEAVAFDGLLVDAVERLGVASILRGLRAFSDFEYELQMALMNRKLKTDCETLFMMPSSENSFISSRLIKEIALCGGNYEQFVPAPVAEALKVKLGLK